MKLTRKPLATFTALLMFGLPPDVVWGDSNASYSRDSVPRNQDGSGLAGAGAHRQIAFDVADVCSDVTRINNRIAQLKQRVLLLELRIATTLRQYQAEAMEPTAVGNRNSNHTRSAEKKSHLMPVRLSLRSIQPPVELNIVPPELAMAEELAAAEPDAVVMPSKIDATVAEMASPQTDELAVFDSSAASAEIVEPSIVGEELAMNDTILGEMRGGFTTTSGLQVTFGIERVLYVNGALISTTSLNVLNLGNVNVTPVAPVAVNVAANLPNVANVSTPAIASQTNAGVPAASTPVPSGAASPSAIPSASTTSANASAASAGASSSSVPVSVAVPAATATSTSTAASASSSASSSTQTPSVTNVPGSVALIQVGGGNIVSTGALSTSSAGTVIQNTLNNQKIQNVTVVNATVNSMQILKELNLQAAISSAINDSVRK